MTLEKSVTHVSFNYDDQDTANNAYLLLRGVTDLMEEEKCKTLVVGDVTMDYHTLVAARNLLNNIDLYHIGIIK